MLLCFKQIVLCQNTAKTISNVFADYSGYWAYKNKADFFLKHVSTMSIKFTNNKLTLSNSHATNSFHEELIEEIKKNAEELYAAPCFKTTVKIEMLGADKTKYSGVTIQRDGWTDKLNVFHLDSTINGFDFLINGEGNMKLRKVGSNDETLRENDGTLLFTKNMGTAYQNGINSLVIERKWLNWNFYLNNKLFYTLTDSTIGTIAGYYFITGPGAKAAVSEPSIIIYTNELTLPTTYADSFKCYENGELYFNSTYGFTLCADTNETIIVHRVDQNKVKHAKLMVSIQLHKKLEGTSDIIAYPILLQGETNRDAAFTAFEKEISEILKNPSITNIQFEKTVTGKLYDTKYNTVSNIYSITTKSGGQGVLSFNYVLKSNAAMDAICFVFTTPDKLPAVAMDFHCSSIMEGMHVLNFE